VLRAGGNPVGVLLDPPYAEGCDVYSAGSGKSVWGDVCAWAVETGRDSSVRIVLCGYDGTWTPPHDWRELAWKARGGYGNGGDGAGRENAARERLWLSPGCLDPSALRQSVLL